MLPLLTRALVPVLALGLLVPTPAAAGVLRGTDPAGDVDSAPGREPGTEVPPHAELIDIVGFGADAGVDETVLWLDIPRVDPSLPTQYSWGLDHTGDGRSDHFLALDAEPWHVVMMRIERTASGSVAKAEVVDCPSLSGAIDPAAGRVQVRLASSCLDDAGASFDLRVGSNHLDDAGSRWVDQAPTDDPFTYHGPVRRGEHPSVDAPPARATDDSCPDGEVPDAAMSDADGTTHDAAIDCVVWWGLSGGDGSGGYGPQGVVRRDQMATFIARMLERTARGLPAASADRFGDDAGNPHEESINRLAEAGIVTGGADGTFSPEARVTRAQMASFLVRAHDYAVQDATEPSGDHFGDDTGNPHERAINILAELGVTGGSGAGYAPAGEVTRGQMASFLARMLDVLVEASETAPPS